MNFGESCSTQEAKERRIPRVTGGEKETRNTRGINYKCGFTAA